MPFVSFPKPNVKLRGLSRPHIVILADVSENTVQQYAALECVKG